MVSESAIPTYAGAAAGMPRKLFAVLVAAAGLLFLLIACGANREIAQDVGSQVAQEESAFCMKLEPQAGARYDSCLREVSRLVQREQEIRSVEF